jgi:hypothetical protein|nr:MAG TPA: hypothetical protein [Caudoviricetes sp.]
MEYEILVEKDSNGRVIVDFYGLDFDITEEFVNGKCHKVIFGDPIVFVLKEAEAKDEPVENSNTVEEVSETHEEIPEREHSGEVPEHSPVETPGDEVADDHSVTSEEAPAEEKTEESSEGPVSAPVENTEESHSSDDSNNENTPMEEDVMEDHKETEHNPETQEGEN